MAELSVVASLEAPLAKSHSRQIQSRVRDGIDFHCWKAGLTSGLCSLFLVDLAGIGEILWFWTGGGSKAPSFGVAGNGEVGVRRAPPQFGVPVLFAVVGKGRNLGGLRVREEDFHGGLGFLELGCK